MKQLKQLDRKALEKRITKSSVTKDALRDVTPFIVGTSSGNTRIIVKKDKKNV